MPGKCWPAPGRTVLTLFSVVIGVATVASVSLAIGTTRRTYQEMFEALTGRADAEVSAAGTGGIDEKLVAELEQIPGVKAAVPMIQRPTLLYFKNRKTQVLMLGIDPARDREVRDYEVAAGSFLDASDGAMLDVTFAQELGIRVGDTIKVLTGRAVAEGRGAAGADGSGEFSEGASLFLPLSTTQRFFGRRGRVDSIQLVKQPGAGTDTLLAEVNRHLPAGVTAGGRRASARILPTKRSPRLERGLDMAAALSELLAVFIILNTFLMSVTERRPQLAILRVVGAAARPVGAVAGG